MKSAIDSEDNISTFLKGDTDTNASEGEFQNDANKAPPANAPDPDTSERLPFIPEWIFGLARGVGVLNMGRGRVCYAASHYVVIFNYETHQESLLIGHKNAVTSMTTDAARKLLVTADSGTWESFVLLWKKDKWTEPIIKLKPPSRQGTRFAALSQDGKYLITLSEGLPKAVLNLWEISNHMKTNEPSAVVELSEEHGQARKVAFCPDCTEFSAVTCSRNVIFLNWTNGYWTEFYSEEMSRRTVGRFVNSIYMSGTDRVASITTHGCVVIWTEKHGLPELSNQKTCVDVIKLEHRALTVICEMDGMMVIGDVEGQIRFYDQTFKTLLLWLNLEEGDGIKSLSFALDESQEEGIQPQIPFLYKTSAVSFPSVSTENGPMMIDPRSIRDATSLRKCLMGPMDFNAENATCIQLPFVPRDVIVHTIEGRTSLVSFQYMRCVTINNPMYECTCATTHPSKPHLIIGNTTGELKVYNFEQREMVLQSKIWHASLSCMRVSPDGHTLMIGSSDGTVMFLHPLLLKLHSRKAIHHHTQTPILGPIFSNDSQYMAHYDSGGYVSAYRCLDRAKGRWLYLGKKMIHPKVLDLLFGQEDRNAPLFSIGEDKMVVEYDVVHSIGGTLSVKRSDRISIVLTPLCMMWCPVPQKFGPALLVSYNEYKTNVINLSDRSSMITANGPFFPYPIAKLLNLRSFSCRPHTSEGEKVAVFVTKCYIGLMKCPPEGTPFDTVATFGHSDKIDTFIISGDLKYLFTLGQADPTVVMYRINLKALEIRLAMSSPGLEPYLGRLEGGRDGWLFQEMIHAFCYAQILHQGVKNKKVRDIKNSVPLCEIPDLIRAAGVFTSQFVLNSVSEEIAWKGRMCSGIPGNSVTFEEYVKLVVNHYHGLGVYLSSIKAAFDEIGHAIDENISVMSRDRFISVLTEKGEAMSPTELKVCLVELLGNGASSEENEAEKESFVDEQLEREELFSSLQAYLPEEITYSFLIEQILGIIVEDS